ncbi:MAG: hypothetical protein JNK02_02225 [Planctomycetes bacterium]|nr:hypothetical protein [Planctomycetota bacterium]
MKVLAALVLLLVAACGAPAGARPELARSEVVVLAHQPAEEVAARVCGVLHGTVVEDGGRRRPGCSSPQHASKHAHEDGATHVSLIVEATSNSIVLAAPPGREADLERALALVRAFDVPTGTH